MSSLSGPCPPYLSTPSINLLAGAPKVGKTALVAGMFHTLRAGDPLWGQPTQPVPGFGVVAADRSWAEGGGAEWFRRADVRQVPVYALADDPAFDPARLDRTHDRIGLLADCLDRLDLPQGAVCFVDPLALFLGGNLLDYDIVARGCLKLRRLCRQRQLCLIGSVHTSKQKTGTEDRYLRLEDRVLGSAALIGYTDTTIVLVSPEEAGKPFYLVRWIPHLAEAQTHPLERLSNGLFTTYDGARNDTIALVLDAFPSDTAPVTVKDLLRLLHGNLSRMTLHRCLNWLCDQRQIARVRHGVYARIGSVH